MAQRLPTPTGALAQLLATARTTRHDAGCHPAAVDASSPHQPSRHEGNAANGNGIVREGGALAGEASPNPKPNPNPNPNPNADANSSAREGGGQAGEASGEVPIKRELEQPPPSAACSSWVQ